MQDQAGRDVVQVFLCGAKAAGVSFHIVEVECSTSTRMPFITEREE